MQEIYMGSSEARKTNEIPGAILSMNSETIPRIRVALVEDNSGVRENLSVLVDAAPGFSCVGKCASAEEALKLLPALQPDVVLMDINLPALSGIACVARLRNLLPKTYFIMLTIEEDSDQIFESLKAGATGYLVKHVPPEEILSAIKQGYTGGAPMSGNVARKVVHAFRETENENANDKLSLSPREEQVLRLLAKGHRSKEIADELNLGIGTVNTHVRHIYEKLHVRSRAEAVARFMGK